MMLYPETFSPRGLPTVSGVGATGCWALSAAARSGSAPRRVLVLAKEELIAVRSMDADMARGALLEPRIQQIVRIGQGRFPVGPPAECARAVMAFQAHREHYRTA